MVKWKKIFKIVGLSSFLLAVLISITAITLLIVKPDIYAVLIYKIQYKRTMESDRYVMPPTKEIIKPNLDEENFMNFQRFNLKFTLPFNKTDISVLKDTNTTFIAKCSNDIRVALIDHQSVNQIINGLIADKSKFEKIKKLLGEKPLESDFEFLKFMLKKNSEQIDFFSSTKDVAINEIASTYVEIMFASKNTIIIYNSEIKGFEALSGNLYSISFYDNKNNNYAILVSGNNVTQEEIDYILSSIQRIN